MNDISTNGEKWDDLRRLERSFKAFKNFVRVNQLIDIGFEGVLWSWSNQ